MKVRLSFPEDSKWTPEYQRRVNSELERALEGVNPYRLVPAGGAVGQVLVKSDDRDYTMTWGTASYGASVQATWNFDTATTATDPGNKKFKFNNATLASVTAIYVNDTTNQNFDASTIIGFLQSGNRIYVQQHDDPTRAALFSVSGVATDNAGWWTIPVTVVSSGALPSNNNACVFVINLSPSGGGGVSDGDKGDISVTASGATWTIDSDVVTFAKMQNIATARVLGRTTALTGDVEELTFATLAAQLDHGTLTGLGDHDHTIYPRKATNGEEISGNWDFSGIVQLGKTGVADGQVNLFGNVSFLALVDTQFISFDGDTTANTGFSMSGIDAGGTGAGGNLTVRAQKDASMAAGSTGAEAKVQVLSDLGSDGSGVYISQHDTTMYRAGFYSWPRISGGASRTLAREDQDRLINMTGTVTVPPNSSVAFTLGSTVPIYNDSGSAITIAQGSGVTIRLDGTATTGNRTLAQRGIGFVTKVATDEWVAWGGGVT